MLLHLGNATVSEKCKNYKYFQRSLQHLKNNPYNIILNDEGLNIFLQRSGRRQRCLLLSLLFDIIPEVLEGQLGNKIK